MSNGNLSAENSSRSPGTIVTFASMASGMGRTGAIANVAIILASAGRRVLVVDWTTESLTVDDYLERFHAGTSEPRSELVESTELILTGGPPEAMNPAAGPGSRTPVSGWRTRHYHLPDTIGDVHLVRRLERWRGWLPPWDGRQAECVRLRGLLRHAGYDYVLIDGPTAVTDQLGQIIAHLSDTIVITFPMGRFAVEAAMSTVDLFRGVQLAPRIIPVPAQVDEDDAATLAHHWRQVQDVFGALIPSVDPLVAGPSAERPYIPYRRHGLAEGILATMADRPGDAGTLLSAYERLTAAITNGTVTKLSPPSPGVRARYRQAMGIEDAGEPELISVVHAVEDRSWADWIRAKLEAGGVRVETVRGDTGVASGRLLIILSSQLKESWLNNWLARADTSAAAVVPVVVRVAAGEPSVSPESVHEISLTAADELHAHQALLSHFGLVSASSEATDAQRFGPRYPGARSEPPTMRLPVREGVFLGRDEEMEALRDRLLSGADTPGRAVLGGPPGVGKSELARRYAIRFLVDYDIVWWIPAGDVGLIRGSLTELAAELKIASAGDAAAATLARLGSDSKRTWLLIYDDVQDPEAITELMPASGQGHVIITTRLPGPGSTDAPMERLSTEDGARILQQRAGPLGRDRALQIVEELDGLPFSLNLAAGWLCETTAWLRSQGSLGIAESNGWAAAEFLARIGRSSAEPALQCSGSDGSAEGPATSAARCLKIVLEALEDGGTGSLTVRLLELCAWISPDGIGTRLLCSGPVVAELRDSADEAGVALADDSVLLHQLLRTAARYGLVEVTWGSRPMVRVHKMLQELVRAGMGAERAAERQTRLLRALATRAPSDAEVLLGDHQTTFSELQPHMRPSGAMSSVEPAVRRWLIHQIRYLSVTGDRGIWESALRLAEELLGGWRQAGLPRDPLTARLCREIANLKRSLGDHKGALEYSFGALVEQRRSLGTTHLRTLITARGVAADLRALGRFHESLVEIQSTYAAMVAELGEDHPETLLTLYNLSTCWFLMGDHEAALSTVTRAWRLRALQLGDDDWRTLWMARDAANLRRELGAAPAAKADLLQISRKVRALRPRRHLDEFHVLRSLAIAERALHEKEKAYTHDAEVYQGFGELLGPAHPVTLAAMLNLATDLSLMGEHEEALARAERAIVGFEELYEGTHPFTLVARTDLSAFLLDAGEAAESVRLAAEAYTAMGQELGDQHPWTLAAGINYTRSLVATGDLDRALGIDEETNDDCLELLGPGHPYTRFAALALADSRRRTERAGQGSDPTVDRPVMHLDVPTP